MKEFGISKSNEYQVFRVEFLHRYEFIKVYKLTCVDFKLKPCFCRCFLGENNSITGLQRKIPSTDRLMFYLISMHTICLTRNVRIHIVSLNCTHSIARGSCFYVEFTMKALLDLINFKANFTGKYIH